MAWDNILVFLENVLICNWIKYPGFHKEAFILLLLKQVSKRLPSWFQQACSLVSSKREWQKFINMNKFIQYILWLWSDLGIRCAMRAGQSMTSNQISEPYQSKAQVYVKRLCFVNNIPQSHVCAKCIQTNCIYSPWWIRMAQENLRFPKIGVAASHHKSQAGLWSINKFYVSVQLFLLHI